jgi:hypothetical protein
MKKTTRKIDPESDYVLAAVEFQNARDKLDHKLSNRAHDRIIRAARKIRKLREDQGETFFRSLLDHKLPHVVGWAAFNLLAINPKIAVQALRKQSKLEPSEARFDSETTLKEWHAGNLDPDWFMKANKP